MEEVLNNQQARPGDATQFMHFIFSSEEEMKTFYLTLNRCINPEDYLIEKTDRERLEKLAHVLYGNVAAYAAVRSNRTVSVKDAIIGLGMLMQTTYISLAHRRQSADMVGRFVDWAMNIIKYNWQFRKMEEANKIHLQNVEYLLDRMATPPSAPTNSPTPY